MGGRENGGGVLILPFFRIQAMRTVFQAPVVLDNRTGRRTYVVSHAITDAHGDDTSVNVDAAGCLITPGLVDIHINGAFDVDFSHFVDEQQYSRDLAVAAAQLPRTGVVAFLPTLFSSVSTRYQRVLPVLAANAVDSPSGAKVLGWHAEGPFMQMARRGAHSEHVITAALADLDVDDADAVWARFEQMYGADNLRPNTAGVVRMITLAPELFSDQVAAYVIRTLVGRGVTVAIGHTSCSSAQMANAVQAGATLVTHLFNAMPGLHHREPGIVGTALHPATSPLHYSLIADGVHVADTALAIAFSARPDRCILITDALPQLRDTASELPDGVYEWKGTARHLRKKGSSLFLASTPDTLAGSCVPLCEHVLRIARVTQDLSKAILAASQTPLALFGLTPDPNDICIWKQNHSDGPWILSDTYIQGARIDA